MNDSTLGRFFGVVVQPKTWLNVLFHILAFPLGLFYFVFLVTGLSVGVGLVIVWVGIPILLLVAGAWWLFGAFERVQAQYLLRADVGPAPRAWESVEGVWGKLKAHFGSAATWKDLVYLLAKLAFGVASFVLLVTLGAVIGWLVAFPVAWWLDVNLISWGNGQGWTPPLWLAIVAVPGAFFALILSLHVVNAWGWVCARWAELMLGRARSAAPPTLAPGVQVLATPAPPVSPFAPPVSPPVSPPAPIASPPPPASPPSAPTAPEQTTVMPTDSGAAVEPGSPSPDAQTAESAPVAPSWPLAPMADEPRSPSSDDEKTS